MIVKQGEQSRKQASDLLYILARQKNVVQKTRHNARWLCSEKA